MPGKRMKTPRKLVGEVETEPKRPEFVEALLWLKKHWRRHWLMSIMLVIGTSVWVIAKLELHKYFSQRPPHAVSAPSSPASDSSRPPENPSAAADKLHDDAVRMLITTALNADKPTEAIEILRQLPRDDLQQKECGRTFIYCIQHTLLSEARIVAQLCFERSRLEEALRTIEHETIKR